MNKKTIHQILEENIYSKDFFENYSLDVEKFAHLTVKEMLKTFTLEELEHKAINPNTFEDELDNYIEMMLSFIGENSNSIEKISILSGFNKNGEKEDFKEIVLKKSDMVSIVGATGSGKSRLLGDIEWLANRDTPTGRKILIDGKEPDYSQRYNPQNKIVAQLSQNMNFVMDLTVYEFLEMHANSRMIPDPKETVDKILLCANDLAGESFRSDTNITSLSGGQSRALMIADTAILSKSSIVLIDEIENAGIDRYKALSLLTDEEKIVLIATHDPALALMADRRLIIKNGGIADIIETSEEEKKVLSKLDFYENALHEYREQLRYGKILKA